ncbi:MAG: triple tyrosine motif-containing protein [Chitinophagaceae bacterium]
MQGIILIGWHVLAGLSGYAQNTIHFNIKQFDQQNGLESYNIRKVTEDAYGFIWVAHQEGINRFDGSEFIKINRLATGGLTADKDTRDIVYDSLQNCIWALEGEERLLKIDPVTNLIIQSLPVPKINANDWNMCMLVCPDNVWIGTSTGVKRFNIQQQSFAIHSTVVGAGTNEALNEVRSLIRDNSDHIWAFSSGNGYTIFSADGNIITRLPGIGTTGKSCRVWNSSLYQNKILLATEKGLYRIPDHSATKITEPEIYYELIGSVAATQVYSITVLPDNRIMVAADRVTVLDSQFTVLNSLRNYDADIAGWLQGVRSGYVSKKGFVWLSSLRGLMLVTLRPSPIEAFRYDENFVTRLGHVFSLALNKSKLFIATESKLMTLHDNHLQEVSSQSYQYLFSIINHGILGSNDLGSEWVDEGTKLPLPEIIRKKSFNSCVCLGDSICLLGTGNYQGICEWDLKTGTVNIISSQTGQGLSSDVIKNLFLDAADNLWVLSYNSLSVRPSGSRFFKPVATGVSAKDGFNLYFDMCQVGGDYWIAVHQQGLLQLDRQFRFKRLYTQKDGLSNNGVYKLFPLGDSAIYITTNHGLSVINIRTKQFSNYFVTDGLHSNAFEEACGIAVNGRMYAGGLDGFSIINPSDFTINTSNPDCYVKRIRIELPETNIDSVNLESGFWEIPSNAIQTTVYFSAINFANPAGTTFSYRIKELNSNWISIGNQHFINLIGLAPGTYTLLLQARNEDGFSGPVRQVRLEFLPKWYQTAVFKALLVSLLAGLFWLVYWLRIRQLRREQSIRATLANDLHDDLGSTLNSVKMFAHLASSDKNSAHYIEKIKQGLTEAIRGLRDIIWIMDDEKNSISALVQRLWQFGEPLCNAYGIKMVKHIESGLAELELSAEERRSLYLILKEAINNSLKYAGADRLELSISIINRKLQFQFRDNGCGFDADKIAQGNGLRSMKTRASQIHYSFDITSGEGTIIRLTHL